MQYQALKDVVLESHFCERYAQSYMKWGSHVLLLLTQQVTTVYKQADV